MSDKSHPNLIFVNHYAIQTPLISYHDKNERSQADKLISRLILGENLALISDAGSPLISDPGYNLVLDYIKKDIMIARGTPSLNSFNNSTNDYSVDNSVEIKNYSYILEIILL